QNANETLENGTGFSPDVQVSLSSVDSVTRKGEPLVFRLSIDNRLSEAIKLDLGEDRKAGILLSLALPDGRTVQLQPPSSDDVTRPGKLLVEPGQVYSQDLILNQWIQLDLEGPHVLKARLVNPVKTQAGKIIASNTTTIPFDLSAPDRVHLKSICAWLTKRII